MGAPHYVSLPQCGPLPVHIVFESSAFCPNIGEAISYDCLSGFNRLTGLSVWGHLHEISFPRVVFLHTAVRHGPVTEYLLHIFTCLYGTTVSNVALRPRVAHHARKTKLGSVRALCEDRKSHNALVEQRRTLLRCDLGYHHGRASKRWSMLRYN